MKPPNRKKLEPSTISILCIYRLYFFTRTLFISVNLNVWCVSECVGKCITRLIFMTSMNERNESKWGKCIYVFVVIFYLFFICHCWCCCVLWFLCDCESFSSVWFGLVLSLFSTIYRKKSIDSLVNHLVFYVLLFWLHLNWFFVLLLFFAVKTGDERLFFSSIPVLFFSRQKFQ